MKRVFTFLKGAFLKAVSLGVLWCGLQSHAETGTITVRRAKKQNAIVKFVDVTPIEGTSYKISTLKEKKTKHGDDEEEDSSIGNPDAESESGDSGDSAALRRKYTLGLTTALAHTSGVTLFSFDGKFGWNLETLEIGPLLGFTATSATFAMKLGVYGDLNFIKNQRPTQVVVGAGLDLSFDIGANAFTGVVALPIKLFVLANSNTALRFDPFLSYTAPGNALGFGLKGGLQAYF